jgi:hypothetical protein
VAFDNHPQAEDDAVRLGPRVPRPARHLHRGHFRRWRQPLIVAQSVATSSGGGLRRTAGSRTVQGTWMAAPLGVVMR